MTDNLEKKVSEQVKKCIELKGSMYGLIIKNNWYCETTQYCPYQGCLKFSYYTCDKRLK